MTDAFAYGFTIGVCIGFLAGFTGLKGLRFIRNRLMSNTNTTLLVKVEQIESSLKELKAEIRATKDLPDEIPTQRL